MEWLDRVLREQYQQVGILKVTDEKCIFHLRHKTLGTDLVWKTFPGSGEAYRCLMGISHPHLPRIFEVQEENGRCTVLEEYIDGITVSEILESGLYTEEGASLIGVCLCDALSLLHEQGFVHRDVKPENVTVDNNGRILLMDFDICRRFKRSQTADTQAIGTAGYAAPEQFGMAQSDCRTDIFSMGILLNAMVTGEHPSRKMAKGRLGRVIDRCIQVDPDKRYQTADKLKRALTLLTQ